MLKQPLKGLPLGGIDNIYLFIADSVRFDARPRGLESDAHSFKTVAHALMTAQSVPTMLSGRLPPRHGVTWFEFQPPTEYRTLFDLSEVGYTVGLNQLRWGDDEFATGLPNVFDNPAALDLESVEEPFICIDHDMGGHAPYPTRDGESIEETFSTFSGDPEGLRGVYDKAVDASTEQFEERVQTLSDRGLLDNTLVIYTSDHGELLGEHGGFCSHLTPSATETVYVPTMFFHPDLKPAKSNELPLLHHVDLVPTICDLLGVNWKDPVDGEEVHDGIEADRPAYTHGFMHAPSGFQRFGLDPAYVSRSVWTRDGGHVFNDLPAWKRPIIAGYDAFLSQYTSSFMQGMNPVRRLASTGSMYFPDCKIFGSPSLTQDEARGIVETVKEGKEGAAERIALNAEQRERLEDLGYV